MTEKDVTRAPVAKLGPLGQRAGTHEAKDRLHTRQAGSQKVNDHDHARYPARRNKRPGSQDYLAATRLAPNTAHEPWPRRDHVRGSSRPGPADGPPRPAAL